MMRIFFLLASCLLIGTTATAQIFGGNRPSLKFYQLKTDTVRIIFPKALEKEAREVAWLSHQMAQKPPASLGTKLRRFDIVLQNQTTSSNAYVAPAPWRSEFFMMPDLHNLSASSLNWHQSLAVHEFRHIEQFSNFNRGIQKFVGVFLGQEGQALAMGAAVPDWFWEGDAVWQETMNTTQGRGRLPDFFNAYRALWLSNKNYSYQKLRNGSYRHFVPDHYDLGYLLVSYGRDQYGEDFWTKVTGDALQYKGVFYPFQKAVKKYAGVSYKDFVDNAFQFYQQKMELKTSTALQKDQELVKPIKNSVTSYRYPFVQDDESILVVKSGYRQIPVWTKIFPDGTEQKLGVKDIADDHYFSGKQEYVVYSAYETNPRWGWEDYSVLKVWNTKTNEVQKISHRSRLFMPDITANGEQVVAVQVNPNQQWSLQLINTKTKEQKELPNKNQYAYTYPKFNADHSKLISAVRNKAGEMSLLQTDLQSGEEILLMPFVNTVIGYIQVAGDTILLSASNKTGDVLYLFDLQSKKLFRSEQLPNGNYQATIDQRTKSLVWNTFTSDGMRLLKKPIAVMELQQVEQLSPVANLYLKSSSFAHPDLLKNVQEQPGVISRYKPGFHLLNIHSWRPILAEPEYGLTIFSENILNTFTGEYGYLYNRNDGSHQVNANIVYGGWFPYVSVGGSQTWNRNERLNQDTTITWNETNANFGLSIPLNFTSGKMFKTITFASSINTEQLNFTGIAKSFIRDDRFNYINSSVRWLSQSQRASQQLFPKWAQSLSLQYKRTVNGRYGNQFMANAALYFPGFARNHHLILMGSLYARDTIRGAFFSSSFPFARGYNAVNFPRMWRFSANYHFPIAYPEFGIANLVYFLRIRANAFYDYTLGKSLRTGRIFPLSTVGTELYFDTRIWNTFFASFGIRYSHLLKKDLIEPGRSANQFEVILPLNLY